MVFLKRRSGISDFGNGAPQRMLPWLRAIRQQISTCKPKRQDMPELLVPKSTNISLPWKNGRGVTDEVFIQPATASRDAFELRVSSAPIAGRDMFSGYPGVDRWITVIEGAGLTLDFGDHSASLNPFRPYRFDSSLMPVGCPMGSAVRVVNVMAAHGFWTLGKAEVCQDKTTLSMGVGVQAVVFSITGQWRIASPSTEETRLAPRDMALLWDDDFIISPVDDDDADAKVLVVPMKRAWSA